MQLLNQIFLGILAVYAPVEQSSLTAVFQKGRCSQIDQIATRVVICAEKRGRHDLTGGQPHFYLRYFAHYPPLLYQYSSTGGRIEAIGLSASFYQYYA